MVPKQSLTVLGNPSGTVLGCLNSSGAWTPRAAPKIRQREGAAMASSPLQPLVVRHLQIKKKKKKTQQGQSILSFFLVFQICFFLFFLFRSAVHHFSFFGSASVLFSSRCSSFFFCGRPAVEWGVAQGWRTELRVQPCVVEELLLGRLCWGRQKTSRSVVSTRWGRPTGLRGGEAGSARVVLVGEREREESSDGRGRKKIAEEAAMVFVRFVPCSCSWERKLRVDGDEKERLSVAPGEGEKKKTRGCFGKGLFGRCPSKCQGRVAAVLASLVFFFGRGKGKWEGELSSCWREKEIQTGWVKSKRSSGQGLCLFSCCGFLPFLWKMGGGSSWKKDGRG